MRFLIKTSESFKLLSHRLSQLAKGFWESQGGILQQIHTQPKVEAVKECRSVMSDFLQPHGLHSPWDSPGQTIGVDSLSLLQGIFPTQRSNPGLPHCRQILCQLSHKGSPWILEWVAYPFSSRSWGPLHCGGFFTNWAIREANRGRFVSKKNGCDLGGTAIRIMWNSQSFKDTVLDLKRQR